MAISPGKKEIKGERRELSKHGDFGTTTNATPIEIWREAVPVDRTIEVIASIRGRRCGGSSEVGAVGDYAIIEIDKAYTSTDGILTQQSDASEPSKSTPGAETGGWSAALSIDGGDLVITANGADDTTIVWSGKITVEFS